MELRDCNAIATHDVDRSSKTLTYFPALKIASYNLHMMHTLPIMRRAKLASPTIRVARPTDEMNSSPPPKRFVKIMSSEKFSTRRGISFSFSAES